MLVGRSVPHQTLKQVEDALLNDDIVRTVYGTKGIIMGSDQVGWCGVKQAGLLGANRLVNAERLTSCATTTGSIQSGDTV